MADYPAFPQVAPSRPITQDGTVLERAYSGKPRLRTFWTQSRTTFSVVHWVTEAQVAELNAFYTTNRKLAFTFDWQGDTPHTQYTVRFVGPPDISPNRGGDGEYIAKVTLVEF